MSATALRGGAAGSARRARRTTTTVRAMADRGEKHRGRAPAAPGTAGGLVAQILQRDLQIRHRLEAPLGLLAEAAEDELRELLWDLGRERLGLPIDDRGHDLHHGAAPEGPSARDRLVEHRTEGKDVAARVDGAACRLLRRHVVRRAEDDAGLRPSLKRCRQPARLGALGDFRLGQLRQAEVEDLDVPVAAHHEVFRLQIAMHDPGAVRRRQCRSHLHRNLQRLADRHAAPAREQRAEGLALDELRGNEVVAVGQSHLVNRENVRMIERGGRLRLLLEPRQAFRILRVLVRQNLQRDAAAEARILGQVDLSHPARTELLEDAVVRQDRANHCRNGFTAGRGSWRGSPRAAVDASDPRIVAAQGEPCRGRRARGRWLEARGSRRARPKALRRGRPLRPPRASPARRRPSPAPGRAGPHRGTRRR